MGDRFPWVVPDLCLILSCKNHQGEPGYFPPKFKYLVEVLKVCWFFQPPILVSREISLGKCNPPGTLYFSSLTRGRIQTADVTKPGIMSLDQNEQQQPKTWKFC